MTGIRLLQWNCMYSEDADKLAQYIARSEADIVCLQELTDGFHQQWGDVGQYIAGKLGFHYFCKYGLMTLPDGRPAHMGNGILSRFPLRSARAVSIQDGRTSEDGRVLTDQRYYLQAEVSVNGARLTIGTTHLPFHPRFQTTPFKQAMAEKIISIIPKDGNYVLAGDFNTTPGTKAARSFRQAGLRNAGPALAQPTWTTKPFAIGPWSYDALQWRLDYVLHRGGLRARQARILETELSDHLPVSVAFDIR